MSNMTSETRVRLEEQIAKLTAVAKHTAAIVELSESKGTKKERNSPASASTLQRYDSLLSSVKNSTSQLRVVLEG